MLNFTRFQSPRSSGRDTLGKVSFLVFAVAKSAKPPYCYGKYCLLEVLPCQTNWAKIQLASTRKSNARFRKTSFLEVKER